MHTTNNPMNAKNNETPNQTILWSLCLLAVSVFATLDVLAGGILKEEVILRSAEQGVAMLMMIALIGVYAREGTPGARFIRSYSRHKL